MYVLNIYVCFSYIYVKKKGLLYYGAVITLTILPCSIATYVYKDFQENDDDLQEREKWNMLPLPSICGSIDPRRFACISLCGQVKCQCVCLLFLF